MPCGAIGQMRVPARGDAVHLGGLVGGSAYGANSAYASGYGTQRQYNHAYIQ